MCKFRHCLTELSVRDTIMAWYYSLTFLLALGSARRKEGFDYSRTSVARTSLGPWKFVLDMGSLSH